MCLLASRAYLLRGRVGPPDDPHSLHSFSQFQIPYANSFGNGNPSRCESIEDTCIQVREEPILLETL